MIAIGKAESTEQSTVHVTDLDVFVIMIMLEVSFVVISPVSLWEDVVYSYELINLGSSIFVKDGCNINVIRSLSQFGK